MIKKLLPFITILFLFVSGLNVAAAEQKDKSWQDESIYYLMIDRFNNGDSSNDFDVDANDPKAYHGGDFKGVTLQLDYLKDMGFSTILLTPIFDNEENGYHGYWTKDFNKLDEHFGSEADFKNLVKEAHKRDMKIIVEFPASSIGPNHPWLEDTNKQNWITRNEEATLNLENPEVQAYLIDAAKWWVKETNIDGYKVNQINQASTNFWSQFSKQLNETKADIFLLGDDEGAYTNETKNTGINAYLNYPAANALRSAFAKPDQPTDKLFPLVSTEDFPRATFMDHPLVKRFTHEAVVNNLHPGSRWKLALTYLYTTPGIPMVYYGTEIALEGGEGEENHKQMDFRTDKELVEYITKIGELRNQLPALTKGTFEPLYNKNGMLVFKRQYKDEVIVVAINNTTKSQNVPLNGEKITNDMELRGLINEDLIKEKDGKYNLIIDRDEAEMYVLSEKSGLNIPYIAAMTGVYLLFAAFLFMLIKKGRKRAE